MEPMRESWTDERLDELNDRVDRGFERLGGEIRELRGELNDLRGEMKVGFEGIHRMMFQAAVVLCAALIGLIAVIAAKP